MRTSPPWPPSPPEGPPRGTNFSRRKAMAPLPPSPALTRIRASSMNMRGGEVASWGRGAGGARVSLDECSGAWRTDGEAVGAALRPRELRERASVCLGLWNLGYATGNFGSWGVVCCRFLMSRRSRACYTCAIEDQLRPDVDPNVRRDVPHEPGS